MMKHIPAFYKNEKAINWQCNDKDFIATKNNISRFHQGLAGYKPSRLLEIPNRYGVKLYVKEESKRFTLPSFKILGASWGVFRYLVETFNFCLTKITLAQIRSYISEEHPSLILVAATDGNHGRAVAYMAKVLGIGSRIYVPRNVLDSECDKIAAEGRTEVVRIPGNYDEAVVASFAYCEADNSNRVLIQDFAFSGYEAVPTWIAHGYSTLCEEIPFDPEIIFIPCGAGCFSQGVVTYYRSKASKCKVFLVEPDTAYAVSKSLQLKKPSSGCENSCTIMDGLNCPTISQTAFPTLVKGVSFAGLVSERQCIHSIRALKELNVNAGPCGAATHAAFVAYIEKLVLMGEVRKGDRIVLVSTEAYRDYRSLGAF